MLCVPETALTHPTMHSQVGLKILSNLADRRLSVSFVLLDLETGLCDLCMDYEQSEHALAMK